MQCQPSESREHAPAFHWPVWPVLAVAFFAFAVNVAFARSAIADESAAGESAAGKSAAGKSATGENEAEQPNVDTRTQRRAARIAALFASVDANEDGRVSADEFAVANFDRAMRRGGGPRMLRRERAPRMGGKPSEGDFEAADADANGQLSPQEFEALPQALRDARRKRAFERMDSDGDGYLTAEEFSARMQRQRRASAAKGGRRGDGAET